MVVSYIAALYYYYYYYYDNNIISIYTKIQKECIQTTRITLLVLHYNENLGVNMRKCQGNNVTAQCKYTFYLFIYLLRRNIYLNLLLFFYIQIGIRINANSTTLMLHYNMLPSLNSFTKLSRLKKSVWQKFCHSCWSWISLWGRGMGIYVWIAAKITSLHLL